MKRLISNVTDVTNSDISHEIAQMSTTVKDTEDPIRIILNFEQEDSRGEQLKLFQKKQF